MVPSSAEPAVLIKKIKKARKSVAADAEDTPIVKPKKAKKAANGAEEAAPKKKKRKVSADGAATEPVKKKRKAKIEEQPPSSAASDSADSEQFLEVLPEAAAEEEAAAATPADPLALDNFRLSEGVKGLLREKGIQALFSIQAQTLVHLLDGFDLVGRARCVFCTVLAFDFPCVLS